MIPPPPDAISYPAPTEYLVRTPQGQDYARGPKFEDAQAAADRLGTGAIVIPLDRYLLPMTDEDRNEMVIYTAE